MDQPDEKLEKQLQITNGALRKMNKVLRAIEPIIFDLKDGTLKRVA